MPGLTIKECLATIGTSLTALGNCSNLGEEWGLIKKSYFKKVLISHPDKGGDAAIFRDVQTTFEVLRKIFDDLSIDSFTAALDQSTADLYRGTKEDFKGVSTPSWEYYAEAAKETVATYRVEIARSNRSRCQARASRNSDSPFIEKGSLRVGFMLESGGYGLWVRLQYWRVPSKIWLGLPDPAKSRNRRRFEKALLRMNEVSLSGMKDLERADRKKVVNHVMDKKHWTFGGVKEKIRRKPAQQRGAGNEAEDGGDGGNDEGAQKSGAGTGTNANSNLSLVVKPKEKARFVIPVPGQGAPKGSLSGQTFVVTGLFPEVGGGEGLQLGKDRVRKMITSFGGKVASAVSGRTNVLVVGKDPGFSKVSKARKNPGTRLLSLHDMKVGLERGSLEDNTARPMLVRSFSKGYSQRRGGPNSLALRASKKELAIASGDKPAALRNVATPQGRRMLKIESAAKKRPASVQGSSSKQRKV